MLYTVDLVLALAASGKLRWSRPIKPLDITLVASMLKNKYSTGERLEIRDVRVTSKLLNQGHCVRIRVPSQRLLLLS